MAFWGSRAGAALGESKAWDLGFKPDGEHNYSRHFDTVTKVEGMSDTCKLVPVPVYNKFDGARLVEPIAMACAHELLANEVKDDPSLHAKLADMHRNNQLPPVYHTSPVVIKHGPLVFPTAVPAASQVADFFVVSLTF